MKQLGLRAYFSSKIGLFITYSNNVTICMAKIPTTTATKLKEADLMATTIGIARIMYLHKIEIKPIRPAFGRECFKVIGMDFPIRIKLIMLKNIPNKRPLAIELLSNKTKKRANTVVYVMAKEQILLWIWLNSLFCFPIFRFAIPILFGGFHDLSIHGVAPSGDPEQDENRDEQPFCVEPLIQIIADGKTEKDGARHGQPNLCDQGYIINPFPVFVEIKNTELSSSL
jgi:hypothetical protein